MPGKIYNVCVTMPDLAAAHAEQEARVEAGSWPVAVKLACEEISKRPHVIGKHVRSARIELSVVEGSRAVKEQPAKARDDKGGWQEGFLFDL